MPHVSIAEVFGLLPLRDRVADARVALIGDATTPKSRFGLSSLKILKPALSFPLWVGGRPRGRSIPIYNLFNYEQSDPALGWSVQKTRVRDFRGGDLSYDSHNGTDFAVAPGTEVTAPAPGVVLRVSNEFHRGGLKVFVDHGDGLVTSMNHLARATVRPGDRVGRGDPIGLSGMSGIDGLLMFPWSTPHVHFNVWLDGIYVDPFAPEQEACASSVPIFRDGNAPRTYAGAEDRSFTPTAWDEALVTRAIDACHHAAARDAIAAHPTLAERAMAVLMQQNYFPTRFSERISLYPEPHPRRPTLTLPFSSRDFDDITFD